MTHRPEADPSAVRESYDRVAREYAGRLFDELAGKPLDRQLLTELAHRVKGPICDLGCGPGQIARFLHDQGAKVCGLDVSPAMIEEAQRRSPEIPFAVGDLRALDVPDGAWAGASAFYSLIHFSADELPVALREIRRALRLGGELLVAFHRGAETVHVEELWGVGVCLDFRFFETVEMLFALEGAGFAIERIWERDPYPGVEHPSRRTYVLARKPPA